MTNLKPAILGVIRHLLTTGGGVLVANGMLTDGQAATATGAIVALAGVAWSVFDKRRA